MNPSFEPLVEVWIHAITVQAVEPLIAQVSDSGRELHTKHIEERKNDVGIHGGIRSMFHERKLRFVVEDFIEDIGRVSRTMSGTSRSAFSSLTLRVRVMLSRGVGRCAFRPCFFHC